jgi:hypothetical protein
VRERVRGEGAASKDRFWDTHLLGDVALVLAGQVASPEDLLRKHLQGRGSDFEEAKDEAAFLQTQEALLLRIMKLLSDDAITGTS